MIELCLSQAQEVIQAYWMTEAWAIVNTRPQTHSSVHIESRYPKEAEVSA